MSPKNRRILFPRRVLWPCNCRGSRLVEVTWRWKSSSGRAGCGETFPRRFSDVEHRRFVTKCNGLKISIPGTVRRNRAARYLVLSSFSLFHVYRPARPPANLKAWLQPPFCVSCIHVHPLLGHTKTEGNYAPKLAIKRRYATRLLLFFPFFFPLSLLFFSLPRELSRKASLFRRLPTEQRFRFRNSRRTWPEGARG